MLNGGEYQGVGAVDYGGVEACEVDLGCCFGVVAHTFAYYTYGDAFSFGGGCPAVTGYVEGRGIVTPTIAAIFLRLRLML